MKFWADAAPGNPTEGRSHIGEEAPSRAPLHQAGIPPFPNLSARDTSRVPASPERRERPLQDQEVPDRSYGQGSPDFGGGWDTMMKKTYRGGPIPKNSRSPTRVPLAPRIPPEEYIQRDVLYNLWSPCENGSVRVPI